MAFDPALPANNSLISSSELRDQLTGLKSLVDNVEGELNDAVNNLEIEIGTATTNLETELNNAITGTAQNPLTVATLSQTISNPPTQAQVQAIQDKLNELINALARPIP